MNYNVELPNKAIANFQIGSKNSKVGESVQIFFIPKAMIDKGQFDTSCDTDVCFDCRYSKGNGCYVAKGMSKMGMVSKIRSMAKKLKLSNITDIYKHMKDKFVRFGAYGEPILLSPTAVMKITDIAKNWTGYTHRWKTDRAQEYKDYFMASVDTLTEAFEAMAKGWRFFMVIDPKAIPQDAVIKGNRLMVDGQTIAINCPASKESGKKVQCNTCGLCKGRSSKAKSIFILKH